MACVSVLFFALIKWISRSWHALYKHTSIRNRHAHILEKNFTLTREHECEREYARTLTLSLSHSLSPSHTHTYTSAYESESGLDYLHEVIRSMKNTSHHCDDFHLHAFLTRIAYQIFSRIQGILQMILCA